MHPLEQYLSDIQQIYQSAAGTAETSYYTPLANLLTGSGASTIPGSSHHADPESGCRDAGSNRSTHNLIEIIGR